jgi:hypothetical protein
MPGFRKIATEEEAQTRLQELLSKTTPFFMGTTRFNGAEWLFMRIRTKENAPFIREDELSTHRWSGLVIHEKKWLFLYVDLGGRVKKSFAFDCTSPKTLAFLKDLLRSRRLMVGFSNGRAFRLDPNPATSLVEDIGEGLVMYLPNWQNYYKTTS